MELQNRVLDTMEPITKHKGRRRFGTWKFFFFFFGTWKFLTFFCPKYLFLWNSWKMCFPNDWLSSKREGQVSWKQGLEHRNGVKAILRVTQKESLRTADEGQPSGATGPVQSSSIQQRCRKGKTPKLMSFLLGWSSALSKSEAMNLWSHTLNRTTGLNEEIVDSRGQSITEERKWNYCIVLGSTLHCFYIVIKWKQ